MLSNRKHNTVNIYPPDAKHINFTNSDDLQIKLVLQNVHEFHFLSLKYTAAAGGTITELAVRSPTR